MLDFAIRKSEGAIGRVIFHLVLASVAVLGLVWLSIALCGLLALAFSPPLAAALTGALFIAVAAISYLVSRVSRPAARADPVAGVNPRNEDLISRATRVAERMAPDSPLVALLVALLAGLASVSLPAAMTPFLNKIIDDFERAPETRAKV